jgi:ADP-ribosylglycohydrolase
MISGYDDRRIGALVGLAIGDALGAAVEFRPPGLSRR